MGNRCSSPSISAGALSRLVLPVLLLPGLLFSVSCDWASSRSEPATQPETAVSAVETEPAAVPAEGEAPTPEESPVAQSAPASEPSASEPDANDLARREAELAAREQQVALERELAEKERKLAEKERQLAEASRRLAESEAARQAALETKSPEPEPNRQDRAPVEEPRGSAESKDTARVESDDVEQASVPTREQPPIERRIVDRTLEPGTVFVVELEDTVSSNGSQVGDTFRARVVQDALTRDGQVAVPAGSTMVGTVTEARKLRKVGGQAALGVDFDRLELEDGTSIGIQSSWVGLGTNKKKDKFKILAGAAAGAILGQILGGDTEATIGGAAAGAAAGTAVVATAKGEDVVLPEGSQLEVELEEVVTVRTEVLGIAPRN